MGGWLSRSPFGQRGYCLGVGHIVECWGKAAHTGLLMGSLGLEPKAGQGRDLGDFGRNKNGKIEGQRDKKLVTCK